MTSEKHNGGMPLRTTKKIYLTGNVLMVVLVILFVLFRESSWAIVLPIAAVAIGAVMTWLDYRYWRCPNCHEHLGRRMVPSPNGCKFCGKKLDYDVPIDPTARPEIKK